MLDLDLDTGKVIDDHDIKTEVEVEEDIKKSSYKSIFIVCSLFLVVLAAMILFWYHSTNQNGSSTDQAKNKIEFKSSLLEYFDGLDKTDQNESSTEAEEELVRFEDEFLIVLKVGSDDYDDYFYYEKQTIIMLKLNYLSEILGETPLAEMFGVQKNTHMKVSPDGNIGTLIGYDFSSKKYRFEFINKSKSKKIIYYEIYDIKSKNYCFLPNSKGIVFMSEFGFTKIEFDDNFDQLVNFKEINISNVKFETNWSFFVSEEGILFFLGYDNNYHLYLYKYENGLKPVFEIDSGLYFCVRNLSNYQNMVVISFNANYFIISDLSNLKPKKVSIQNIDMIHNVAISKSGNYLYLIVTKDDDESEMKSIIRIQIVYENLNYEGINVIPKYKKIIEGNYDHYLDVLQDFEKK